ncbi:polymerase delta-interacting protein 3-like isoform X2 [Sitodiplosis mosellana]|uniref:polymerase delta-interacting protein 3-like isoform X2 n=1 Tax=Sitodiplosis mosellana TaxID=263140 RepID=UPI002444BC02|nr:polymerase delta-interacting protein 3-like isoform X2 [Sitodiplosis mosellana]
MDSTALSLDDIIKKKKITKGGFRNKKPINKTKNPISSGGGGAVKKFAPKQVVKAKPVLDARNKIIQKNRAKIHDARDKLAQIAKRSGDARLKLLQKNISFLKKVGELDGAVSALRRPSNPSGGLKTKRGAAAAASSLKRAQPYQARVVSIDDMGMDVDDMEYFPTSTTLRRTVKNEIAYVPSTSTMPPLPTFKYIEPTRRMTTATRPVDYEADPFDCYEVPVARPYDVSEPRNLNRSVLGTQMDSYQPKSIRQSNLEYERSLPSQYKSGSSLMSNKRYIADENSHLSHEMRNRLQRAPDNTQSAGIFTNPYASNSRERLVTNAGYRIVVSNLHSSVSQSDIKELFEDVGPLFDARLVRTGVAEVIFEKLKDAQTAVDTYHNRQLDGQPMKCLLVNPRSSNKPTAPAIKPTKSNLTKSSKVEIDIDALHSVLFRRS